jgi:hypothetical protein
MLLEALDEAPELENANPKIRFLAYKRQTRLLWEKVAVLGKALYA